jgi:hypothetical protein
MHIGDLLLWIWLATGGIFFGGAFVIAFVVGLIVTIWQVIDKAAKYDELQGKGR